MLSKIKGFPGGSECKECAYKAGEPGSVLGLGRFPGEENGNPLQYSCLENPMDGEPGRLQSMWSQRVRHDWVTSLSDFFQLLIHIWLFAIVWTVAHQTPLSMGCSRQEYRSGLPLPPPGNLPNPRTEPRSSHLLHWQMDSLPLSHLGNPRCIMVYHYCNGGGKSHTILV